MSSVSNIPHQFLETKNHLSGEQISIEDNKFLFYYVPRKLFNYVWVKQRLHVLCTFKTKAKLRSLNVHNKDMDNCCLTMLEHKHFSENVRVR